MQITGQVQAAQVPALHDPASLEPDLSELRRRLAELDITLNPTHPGENDPLLAPYFTVDVPDDEELLTRVLELLRDSTAVDAAYVKPPDELP